MPFYSASVFRRTAAAFRLALPLLLAGPCRAGGGALNDYLCADPERPFFRAAGGVMTPARAQSCAVGFTAEKPAGRSRVFVIGESAAGLLDRARVEGPLEVIDCGMGGYDSRRISRVFSEVLNYHPDLIVLLSGNNEGLEDPCPGFAAASRRALRTAKEKIYSLFGGDLPGRVMASLAIHEERISAMAASARRAGIPLVICTLPADLLMPPASPMPAGDKDLAAGIEQFERGNYAAALARLEYCARSGEPYCAYYAGRSLYALRRFGEAADRLGLALDLSPSQERAGPARNEMLRRVARDEGACLADLDADFRKAAPGGIPGPWQFEDGAHWRPAFDAAVWNGIFRAAGDCGIAAAKNYKGAAEKPGRTGDPFRKLLSYAVSSIRGDELSGPAVYLLGRLLKDDPEMLADAVGSAEGLQRNFISNFWSSDTASSLRDRYPVFLFHAAEAFRRAGRPAEALALTEKIKEHGPYERLRLSVKIKALHTIGRDREAQEALQGLAALSDGGEAAVVLAQALGLKTPSACSASAVKDINESRAFSENAAKCMARGDRAGAEKAFRSAVSADPANAGALLGLCLLQGWKGAADEGLEFCLRAAAASSGRCGEGSRNAGLEARALFEAGKLQHGRSRDEEAAGLLKRALSAAPDRWEFAGEARALLKPSGPVNALRLCP